MHDRHFRSARGHRLHLDPEDERARELQLSGGSLGAGSLALWNAVLALRDWDLVVDVGVNYGEMLLGADLPDGARLVGFEPNPRVLPYLRRSIAESGVEVDLREVAVGAEEGEATFLLDAVWSGRSGLAGTHRTDADHPLERVRVPVRTLAAELEEHLRCETDAVCVKVDVEGGEWDVLAGARSILRGPRPWALMVEVLHMDMFEKARLAREFRMRVLDRRSGALVDVPPASPLRVATLLDAGWLHGQDAVLTKRAPR